MVTTVVYLDTTVHVYIIMYMVLLRLVVMLVGYMLAYGPYSYKGVMP